MTTALALTDQVLAKSNGGVLRGKFRMIFARLELGSDRLSVYQFNPWLASFGLIGFLLSRYVFKPKLAIDLPLGQIATLARGKFGLNKKILDLTTTDGTAHRLVIDDYDRFTSLLREQVARHAPLVDEGNERWRVQAA